MRAAAGLRRRQPLSEEEKRELLLREGELGALAQHPAWPVLRAVMEEKLDVIKAAITANVLSDNGMTMERQAYWHGYVHGMRWLAGVPSRAEHSLERKEEMTSG